MIKKIIIILIILLVAVPLLAMEYNSLSDHIPVALRYYSKTDGASVRPDSIQVKTYRLSDNSLAYSAWLTTASAWVTEIVDLGKDGDADTCLFANPTIDQVNGSLGIEDIFIRFGAYYDAEDEWDWVELPCYAANDSTQLIAQRLKWLLNYTGAEPGAKMYFEPFGQAPKTLNHVVGQSYRTYYFRNSTTPSVIDSSLTTED